MSELASVEKRQILCAYGAKVIVTPGIEHTRGARKRAIEYCKSNPGEIRISFFAITVSTHFYQILTL